MHDEDEYRIERYISQFGLPLGKGRKYLKRMLTLSIQNKDCLDCNSFIKQIADEQGVTCTTIKQGISRFLLRGWKRGAAQGWRKAAHWEKDDLPNTMAAMTLICERYPQFIEIDGENVN